MIIGIAGFIGSGKDTIANHLTTTHHFKKMSFASSLKDAVSNIFGWDREMLEGATKSSREWREQRDEWWSTRLNMEITPRWVLQNLGTEVLRKNFNDDIWIASLEYKLSRATDDIVISDVRFKNEVEAIKSVGGTVIRVVRGPEPVWYDAAKHYNRGPDGNPKWSLSKSKLDKLGIHPSEYSIVGANFDAVVDNNSTIDHLYTQVNDLVQVRQSDQ
jgi:hypothetical protein